MQLHGVGRGDYEGLDDLHRMNDEALSVVAQLEPVGFVGDLKPLCPCRCCVNSKRLICRHAIQSFHSRTGRTMPWLVHCAAGRLSHSFSLSHFSRYFGSCVHVGQPAAGMARSCLPAKFAPLPRHAT